MKLLHIAADIHIFYQLITTTKLTAIEFTMPACNSHFWLDLGLEFNQIVINETLQGAVILFGTNSSCSPAANVKNITLIGRWSNR